MLRARRSLGLAILAFGTALSLCTIAAQGRAGQWLFSYLLIGSHASGPNWKECGSAASIVSVAQGFDSNWNFVCEVSDSDGSTHSTPCNNAVDNYVELDQEWNCNSNGCSVFAYASDDKPWGTVATANATVNATQQTPPNGCQDVGFQATGLGQNQ
jgi:hypothetical protein